MAPARAKKRHYRSASAPERGRDCTNSIVNGFKMTFQSNFSSIFVYLLFCVVLLSSNAQSLSARDNVDCTYANSTCSSCADLCLSNEFYPLFPSRCHPSYMHTSLIHSEESYPGRTSSSIRFYGNSSFSVPEDLLPSLTGLKDYTIAVYFKEVAPNGTLFELNNELTIRYTSEQQLEVFLPQLTEKNRDTIAIYDVSLSSQWKSVFFTFQDQSGTLTLLTHFGTETANDPSTLNPTVEFATTITSITIGEGFNGFLQDIRVYVPKLETLNSRAVIPTEAPFLSQCLCPSGYSISPSETQCTATDDQSVSIMRYDTTAPTAEFSTDTSTTTMWQSNNNDSPVSLVVGLSPSISLSKIFITFSSSLPAKTTLQYYSEQWRDLQYFAENCVQSFEMGNDDRLKGSFDVNCLHYTSNTTLTFLLAGTGSNARPLPSEDETSFEVYYNASRVRLIMSGLNSATNFAIRNVEICPNYCLDLERSCTTICPETAGMMTGDEGSGMSMSDILMPSSTVPTALAPSMSTTSSVENNQGNSNAFFSIVTSTSAKMTEVNTVVPFTTTSMMLLQSTTMNFNIPTTMTFISSSTMPIVGATSSLQPVTQPEITSVENQLATSSLAADMFSSVTSSTSINPMTSAVFDQTSSIATPQAPSTTVAAFTSEVDRGISTAFHSTSMPSTTAFIRSSTQVEASSSSIADQGVATSSSIQEVVQTTSTIVQGSLFITTSQAVSPTITQVSAVPITTTQDIRMISTSALNTSLTEETVAIVPTSRIFPMSTITLLATSVQGVTSTVQPSAATSMAASVQPESTSHISSSTTAAVLSSSYATVMQRTPSSGPVSSPISTASVTDIVATPSQSVESTVASSSSSTAFTSLSRTPEPTTQSSSAFEPTLIATSPVEQPATSAPSLSSPILTPTAAAVSPSVTELGTTISETTNVVFTTSMQTVQVSIPPVDSSQSIEQISSVIRTTALTSLSASPTITTFALTDTTASLSPTLSLPVVIPTSFRTFTSSATPSPTSPVAMLTSTAGPTISALTSSTTSSDRLLSGTETSIPMVMASSSVSSFRATTTTSQPIIFTVITSAETSTVSESSLQMVTTTSIGSEIVLPPSSSEAIPTTLPTSSIITPTSTPTMVLPLSTSVSTMIISTEESSANIAPEPTTVSSLAETQSISQAFTSSGMFTSTVEMTQTPISITTTTATSRAVSSNASIILETISPSAISSVVSSSTSIVSMAPVLSSSIVSSNIPIVSMAPISPSSVVSSSTSIVSMAPVLSSSVVTSNIPIVSMAPISPSSVVTSSTPIVSIFSSSVASSSTSMAPIFSSSVVSSSTPIVSMAPISSSATSRAVGSSTSIISIAISPSVISNVVSSSTPIVSMTSIFPEGSGDFGSGDTMSLEPFSETDQISATPTPTPTSQLTTFIFPSSSMSIPSLVISTSTSSFPFSSISPTISTLTPSETSIPTFFTSVSTEISSVTTTLAPSSTLALITTIFSPTPTPTPAILSTPTFLSPCETPLAPLQVNIDGLGFILDDNVTRVESDEDSLTYMVTFGEFIGQSGQLNRSGTLNVMLGGFNGQSTDYNLDADSIASLTGFVSNKEVWSDNPSVSVAFQVRDSSFNSNIDADCEVILTNLGDSTINRKTTNCTTSAPCGTSAALLDIPEQWFMEIEATIIDIKIMVEETMFELGSVTLMPTGPTQIDNAAFMIPPKHSLLPGEEFRLPIYASFDRRLAGFSLDCQILGTAAELRGAESNFTWSLLPRSHPSDSNRISLTGFRNYDRTNTNQINFTESLADLIIAIHPDNQVYESIVEIQCETFKLVLTNGTDLVEENNIMYVRSLNRDGEISMRGRVHIETRNYAGIFACANQNEIINTARLTREVDKINMSVYGFNVMSSELDLLSISAICSSEDENIIKVDMNCMYVYFDGSEMYGAEEISINIIPSSLEVNGSIPFRVWLPSQQISISLADSTLNAIETVATCENGSTLYQHSSFAIMTTISTDTNTTTIYVTSLLRPYLNVSDENIARLTEDHHFIEGIDIGITMIYVSTLDEIYGTEINVTNDTVEAECVDIFAFTSISVEIPDEMIDIGTATITLQQEFDFIGSNLNIVPVVQFSDDSRMLLTEEFNGLKITIAPEMNDVLEQSTPSSRSSYDVIGLINDFNISISWELESLQECENITFIHHNSYMNSESTEMPALIVNATSNNLTASDDAATYFGTPDFVLLEVYLRYNDVFESNITTHDNVTFEVHNNSQHLAELVDHLGQMRRVVTIGTMGGTVTIQVTFTPLNLTAEYIIVVKRTESFILTAYREADNSAISQLNQIGTSGVYQHARLNATIYFTDGAEENVSNNNLTVDVISNNSDIVTINMEELVVNYAGSGFENISLQATLVDSNTQSNMLDIVVDSDPVVVSSITNITLSSTSAEANELVFADCTALLRDGTILSSTFDQDGRPIYPGLITFSTTDLDILSIEQSSGIVKILKNSFTTVSLTASATENVTYTRYFSVSLNPSPGEVGLKTMAAQVEIGNIFEVSIILNSVQEAIGVYELELVYESIPQLEIVNVVQGDNWKNGTVISALKSRGVISIGGVLNTGVESNLAELAVVTFKTDQPGKLSFNVSIDYIANTNVIPNITNVQNSSLSGQIEIQVSDLSQISKREAPFSYDYDYYDEWLPYEYSSPSRLRSKRATCNNTPTAIDINGDCDTDLRDVYVLQEFLASEVYNFSTSQGEQLIQRGITIANIGEPSFSQIFTIEQNSLDLSFTVSGIFYTFFLQDNSAPCQFLVNGTVMPLNDALEFMDIVNIVQIYLDFSHDNSSFQDEFDSTFGEDAIARKNGANGQYGGTIMVELSSERGSVFFMVLANSTFETEAFTLSVLLAVQVDITNQLSSSVDIGSLSIERVYTTIVSGAIESCIPTTQAPPTTQVPATTEAPTSMATTQTSTAIVTTEITTTMATTQFPVTITTTFMSTPQLTSIVTTEVPTTTTNVVLTDVSTTAITSTIMVTSQISSPIITTEFPTIIAASEPIATTEAPSITATPTVVTTPTIMATTEAFTSMATSATSALTTMVTQTTMVSTVPPTTVATTTIMTSTVASAVTTSTVSPTPLAESMTTASTVAPSSTSSIEAPTTMISSTVSMITTSTAASTSIISTAASMITTNIAASTSVISTATPMITTSIGASTSVISTTAPMITTSIGASTSVISTTAPMITTSIGASTSVISTTAPMITTSIAASTTMISTEGPMTTTSIAASTSMISTTAPMTTTSIVTSTTMTSTVVSNSTSTGIVTLVTTTRSVTSMTTISTMAPSTTDTMSTTTTVVPMTTTSTVAPTNTTGIAGLVTTTSTMPPVTTTSRVTPMTNSIAALTPMTNPTIPNTAVSTSTISAVSAATSTSAAIPTSTMFPALVTSSTVGTEVSMTTASTEVPTTMATTESSTIVDTTDPPMTMATTEPPTTRPSTPATEITEKETESASNSQITAISASLGLIAGILAIVVVIFVAVYLVKKYRKKGGYSPRSDLTTPSRRNKGYFFEEEEGVELNPVNCDLVPLDSVNHGFFMENGAESMNLVPNHHIYHSDTEDMIMSGSSMKPLLREPPEPGRQAPTRGKQLQYSESTLDHPPPPYHATGTTFTGTTLTSKSGNSTSPYDIEDDYFDLPFNDDPTQAYLSLGLTPQSQLSPNDHTGSGSDGNNFFPSMPPPVMPSVFNPGIPVDSPFNISGSSGGGMVMPDAFPTVTDPPRKGSSGSRRSRYDHPLSQGYPIKLPPVPEQSDPMEDGLYNGGRQRSRQEIFNERDDSSSSSNDLEETSFMFPSADLDTSSSSQLHRQRGLRKKSGIRRVDNGWSQSSQDGMVISNRSAIGNHRDDVPERDIPLYDRRGSPRQRGKHIRQQARERELQRQREILMRRTAEDERRRILQQEERAAMIAKDYGSTRYREVDIDEQVEKSQGSSRVLQEAMKYEAQMQLMQERSSQGLTPGMNYDRMSQERQHPQRQSSNGHIVNTYDQFTTI